MSSDSIMNASNPNSSKDFAKKKRVNRSAKLKQCKLDARREQWLSQAKSPKEEENGSNNREFDGPAMEMRTEKVKGKEPSRKGVEVMTVNVRQINNHDGDWEESLLENSPTSCVNDKGNNNYAGSSGSSTSRSSSASSFSFSSGRSCSGSITEEDEGGKDGCLDDWDWEAVADALVGAETNGKQDHEVDHSIGEEPSTQGDGDQNVGAVNISKGGANTKAWRPDDAFRPQSLPNLSKQRNFPPISNPWVRQMPSLVPTSCPICCEDLDVTDSNFLPCPCGFHLCLFCHKRILEEDGRCPGCRKPYSSEEVHKETSESGSNLTARPARSCSMFSRV